MPTEDKKVTRGPVSQMTKPWGGEELLAHTDLYALKRIYIKVGSRPSLQYHERKSESLYMVSVRMKVEIGDSKDSLVTSDFLPGDVVDVPRGKIHRFTAVEDSVVFEVSTPELDDVVRLEDDYGRAE